VELAGGATRWWRHVPEDVTRTASRQRRSRTKRPDSNQKVRLHLKSEETL